MNLEKIKGLKGLFYRKIVETAGKETEMIEALPGFTIRKPSKIIEFPTIKDPSKINIIYPLVEPFAYANIKWNPDTRELIYNVIEPSMSEKEMKLLEKVSDALVELVEVGLSAIKDSQKAVNYLETQVTKVIKEFGISLTPNEYIKIMYYIYRNFVGYNEIEPLLQDPNIEDISCDGINAPLYVIHRKFGSIKTNIVFSKLETLREFVIKLAERCGRYVSYAEPILDGTLPDGSRVSATLAGDVATRGPTFTIRKFGEKPFSPIEQMELGTVSSEVLAYFWYLLEHGVSMLIVGGTATGKTSFLNSLCMFIPPEAKIVSIEDTRELKIPHEHWIPGLSRVGFGIPTPTGEKYGEVTLFDLLKESFRQNPSYVIVGETRGNEAYVMFQGMASGHPSLSTFHAGSVDSVIKRLTSPPIELPASLLESLNVITIMVHAKEKGKSARRVKEVVEIESVDPKTDEVRTNTVFRWNAATDEFEKVNESVMVKKIALSTGAKIEDTLNEIEKRKKIIEWLKEKEVRDYLEFTKMVNLYYKEPHKLLEMMEGKVVPQVVEVKEEEKKEEKQRISFLQWLGFKFIKEKV